MKILDTLISWKQSVQAEVLLSIWNQLKDPNEYQIGKNENELKIVRKKITTFFK